MRVGHGYWMFFLFCVNLIVFLLHKIQVTWRSKASSSIGYIIQYNLIKLAYTNVKGKTCALKHGILKQKGANPPPVFHWYMLWAGVVQIYAPLAHFVSIKDDSKSLVIRAKEPCFSSIDNRGLALRKGLVLEVNKSYTRISKTDPLKHTAKAEVCSTIMALWS